MRRLRYSLFWEKSKNRSWANCDFFENSQSVLNLAWFVLCLSISFEFGDHRRSQASFLCFQDIVSWLCKIVQGWLIDRLIWVSDILIRGSLHRFNWLSFYLSFSFVSFSIPFRFVHLQSSPNSCSCLWSCESLLKIGHPREIPVSSGIRAKVPTSTRVRSNPGLSCTILF